MLKTPILAPELGRALLSRQRQRFVPPPPPPDDDMRLLDEPQADPTRSGMVQAKDEDEAKGVQPKNGVAPRHYIYIHRYVDMSICIFES